MAKINIVISDNFLKKLDSFAKIENTSRSEYIREAVETYIGLKEEELKRLERKKKIEDVLKVFREMSKKNKEWNGVEEIVKWRQKRNI